MRSLRGMALQLFKANRLLVTTSIIGITISTMLIITMLLYSMQAQESMQQSFREMYGEADVMVSYAPGPPNILTKEKVDRIISLPEVEQSAQVSYDSLHIGKTENMTVWTFGTTTNELTKSTYKFSTEITPSSLILTQDLAQFLNVEVGDDVSVEGNTLQVSEIIEETMGDVSFAVVHPTQLKHLLEPGEQTKGIMLKLVEDADTLAVMEQLRDIDPELRIDLFEQNEFVVTNLRTLHTYIIILSMLLIGITALLIVSNFEIMLYKLRNQIAILRALGATTKQMSLIIWFQSVVINFSGVIIGALLSILGMRYVFQIVEQEFQLPPIIEQMSILPLLLIAAACFVAFQIVMLIPTYRSTKILPLKIAEENERLDFKHKKRNGRRGFILMVSSLVLYVWGYVYDRYVFIFAGIVFFFLASLFLLPHGIEKILNGVLKGSGRKLGQPIYLAIKNMLPQVKRNTFTIISIALMMSIVVFGSTLLSTLESNNHRFLYEKYEMPIHIENRLGTLSQFDPFKLKEELLQFDSIHDVYFEGAKMLNYIMLDDETVKIRPVAVDGAVIEGIQQDEIVISENVASKYHFEIGDEVTIGDFNVERQEVLPIGSYRIGGISEDLNESTFSLTEYTLIPWSSPLNLSTSFDYLTIDTDDEAQALADVESITSKYPELKVTSLSESLAQAREGFIQRWAIFIVVLVVILGATMIGVINGLLNQILAKRKEFVVLRSVGVQPNGIHRIILTQVILYIGLGAVLGSLVGLSLLGLVILLDPTPITFHIPVIGLMGLTMLLLAIGTFHLVARHLTKRPVPQEMALDGK